MWREENEDKKEKVTYDSIHKDINPKYYGEIPAWIIIGILILLICKLIEVLLGNSMHVPMIVLLVLFITIISEDIIIPVAIINQNKFTVVTDQLLETTEGRLSAIGLMQGYLWWKPHTLRFAAHGEYYIGRGKQYKWSKLYDLSARDVFNSSHPGDTFILIMRGKKILMAYNTRLFEAAEGLLK